MKVIDLKDRTLFVDDIIQLYIEEKYSPERYNIQTTNGIYLVYKEDYFKVKDYLLSLNDEVKEDLKIYELEKQLQQKVKEIERLNNIINELEKWLEEQHQFIIEIPAYTKEISIEHKTMEICYENVLDKLQELKGSDKE